MKLKDIRKDIDHLDARLLKLLNDRMELVLRAKRLKKQIEDNQREKQIYGQIKQRKTVLLNSGFIENIYREIIKESKRIQGKDHQLIAFQGEHGAYGEMAAQQWRKDLVPLPCADFAGVFEGVEDGVYEYGIVPVENTLGGVVGQVNELLINTPLKVTGAIELPIHHCLMALPETDHREIRTVYSHAQALAQCRHFIARNNLEPVSYYDTAGAAKMLAEKRPKRSAAVAGKLAAELYDLEIIKEDIEDLDRNATRFLILAKKESGREGDKCSIIFSTEHKAGTLFSVLEVFAAQKINLTRIESVPSDPGNYVFFLDFIGSNKDANIKATLKEVEKISTRFRLLGCYEERKIK